MGWGKRIGIAALALVGSCGAGAWYLYDRDQRAYEERRADEAAVRVTAVYDGYCTNRDFPLSVTVYNGSRRTLKRASFTIEAHERGHSDDIADVMSRNRDWDTILPPGKRATLCARNIELTRPARDISVSVSYVDPEFYPSESAAP